MAPVPEVRRDPLPIDAFIDPVREALESRRAVVVTAAPGAGKTTRIPPALVPAGRLLLLQPRRVAARSIAKRIAAEQGWSVGREVGWHVRFERNFTDATRLIVATGGVLTLRLQQDPLAGAFKTIAIDEFHERSIHVDVGLALVREAWRARSDLRLVIMSATIDARRVAAYLDDCAVIDVPGRLFPLDVGYRPRTAIEDGIAAVLPPFGAVLCFLPGAPEIRRAAEAITAKRSLAGIPVLPLHGGLDAEAQDAALEPAPGRRIILATNLAETTVTVPDVSAVVDAGLHKVARYDAARAIDSLETERISQDSADQRAGRAGRTRAGTVLRLWDERDRLRPHREAEIARVDLVSTVLDVIAWGGDPRTLDWFEQPPAEALASALALLTRLGGLDASGQLTPMGQSLRRLPLHPRLGRMLLAAGGTAVMSRACALLSERHYVPARTGATSCDLLSAVETESALPGHLRRTADQIRRMAEATGDGVHSEEEFRRAVLAGYPDRVARRRPGSRDRFVLASGAGAKLARESGVINSELIVAVEVTAAATAGGEALIRLATAIERDWLPPTSTEIRHAFDAGAGLVRANRVEVYDGLVLSEHPVPSDPLEAGELLAREYLKRGPTVDDGRLLRRLAFAGVTLTFADLVEAATPGKARLADVALESSLPVEVKRALDRHAPASVTVPSGRTVMLDYRDGGIVAAAVKLQELFGLGDSPRVGAGRVPVTFELLSPAGRPVQVTNDLRSFWTRGYPEVRKELRARYPKHPWPDDPWTAQPTARTTRRK